nr:spore coat protein CotJB [Tuberibacillus sp. Marseille-P3662]
MPEEYYRMLEEIQEVDFVIVELNHYLNTHPQDLEALKQYNSYVKKSKQLRQPFEEKFGPLVQFNSYSTYPWAWKDAPWPWQV